MRAEATTLVGSRWTIMLADVVGLMLAFFVLSFSMRELVPVDPVPATPQEDTVAVLEAPSMDQLRALEQERASSPAFAYLAAIIEANSVPAQADRVWHDDTRLVVRLPGRFDERAVAGEAGVRELLLTLAFLARRFDLDLTLDAPRRADETIEQSLEQAAALRAWLVETAGLDRLEVSYDRSTAAAAAAEGFRAAINARPAQVPATAASGR